MAFPARSRLSRSPHAPYGRGLPATLESAMRYNISGNVMQTVEIDLAPGETIFSQTHAMSWMNDGVNMHTNTGGGLFAGLKRSLTGGSFFVTDFSGTRPGAHVAFAPRFPGTVLARSLAPGESLICRRETFLCAEKSVTLELAWQQRIGSGFFGGAGFILQRVIGPGTVFLDLSGEVVNKTLAPGERLYVHAGHVGVHEPSVSFDIQMVPGFRNILFGGEGLFLANLTGPGQVWLQSMPIMNLAEAIAEYLPQGDSGSGGGRGIAGVATAGILGGLLGGVLGDD
jgi:uncharacterized protein (TIGR00266 family)